MDELKCVLVEKDEFKKKYDEVMDKLEKVEKEVEVFKNGNFIVGFIDDVKFVDYDDENFDVVFEKVKFLVFLVIGMFLFRYKVKKFEDIVWLLGEDFFFYDDEVF